MIASLRLLNFRRYESLALELPARGVVFAGENAQGKTSLLEAICVLVRLHSPRTRRASQMVRFEAHQFGIAGDCWESERRLDFFKGSYQMRVDDEERDSQQSYLSDGGLVVWMGNEDRELVSGTGEVRRRYLDFIASQIVPGYRRALARYKKALKERNALLRDCREGVELAAFTQILIEHGEEVTRGRASIVEGLQAPVAQAQNAMGGDGEETGLFYLAGKGEDFAHGLAKLREREMRQGLTLVGPHRDELKLTLGGLKASEFGSEGQQRTLALALKLAQGDLLRARGGRTPVFLIDDIFGELDPGRRERFLAHLPPGAQLLITTTNADWLGSGLDLEVRKVDHHGVHSH